MPKIEFKYSYIYDDIYRNSSELNKYLGKINKLYPTSMETISFKDRFEVFWRLGEKKILKKISEIIGLTWTEKKLVCYVVGSCRPISDPITIRVFHDMEYAVDMLTHELIHNIQSQMNDSKWGKWQRWLDSKYPKFSATTKSHILVNAVHKKIYLELFNNERFERDLSESNKVADYKNSWSVVEKEGYDNLIRKFKQIMRK